MEMRENSFMRIIVFSSTEGLQTAEAFRSELRELGHEVRLWN